MELAWIVSLLVMAMAAWRFMCAEMRRRRLQLLAKLRDDPHTVNACTMALEFPFLYTCSQELGVMRTFAIPSISSTLRKGNQYRLNSAKRYDDTEILLTELTVHHVDSPRGSLAVRRLNFLHSHYDISNADYLYVLCLITVMPPRWVSKYGFREWTELEISSHYKVWHDIGVRMGIHDIPPTFAGAEKYIEDFEIKHMVYADSNHEITELNVKLFLSNIPSFLHPFARKLLYAFMDDRLREALGYPKQPPWLSSLSHALVKMQGVVVSWMPPRPFARARLRIPFGCPVFSSTDDALTSTLPLTFQRYKPYAYKQGYKISRLGGVKLGKLCDAFEGPLLCPLEKSKSTFPEA